MLPCRLGSSTITVEGIHVGYIALVRLFARHFAICVFVTNNTSRGKQYKPWLTKVSVPVLIAFKVFKVFKVFKSFQGISNARPL
jgi:hypothetical protein